MLEVKLTDLALILQRIFEKMQQRGLNIINLSDIDEYWIVQASEWTNFQKQPEELSVGSLYDDWAELQKIKHGGVATVVDLDRFAALVRAISAKIAPP